jgi:PAS domain S-box-containing protein
MNSDNSNNPAIKRRANDLEEELELVKGMLSRTKEDLEEQTSRSDGLEKLLAKYLEGFGSFEASNRLSTFVERHPEAIVTFELNESIIEWNPAAVKMFGWEKKEIIGRPFPLTDDKYRADFHTQLKSVLRGGQLTKHDMILQAKDGKLLNTRLSTTHLKNEQGKIIGATGIIVDYTELREKSDGAKRLATVVEQSPNMIMITNKDQIIEYVNQRWVEVTGYSQEEMIGKKQAFLKRTRPLKKHLA